MSEFDYHDTINRENYEKYFEKVCQLLKPNSVIVIDNVSYHSRNDVNYPLSKWKKAQFQDWLTQHNIPFNSDDLRAELWLVCKRHRVDKTSKVIDNIAKKYGHEILRLPPYHCELNAIELIWADEKNYVARENKELTLNHVEELFRKRRAEISSTICKNCVEHVKHVQESYWKTDRIVDAKLDKLEIALDVNDNDESEFSESVEKDD